MKRLRRGMSVLDRDKLRKDVLERQLALAQLRAAMYGLSSACRAALETTGTDAYAQAAELHASCKAEEIGGTGCLCPCHDVRDTSVVTGCSG